MPKTFKLAFTCVDVVREDEDDLHDMVAHAKDVAFVTFAKYCDWQPVARQLGYEIGRSEGLHINNDYTAHFKQSKWKGEKCYFIEWSRIEHVFLEPKQ